MEMQTKRSLLGLIAATGLLLAAATVSGEEAAPRTGYSYIRMMTGDATVGTRWNGSVEARRNMPISVGDEISVSQGGRVEIGLADGNALFLGGGSQATFDSLSDQQGEEDQFSAIRLSDGDAVLAAMGSSEEEIPRIDTDDATVYLAAGARVRVNSDPRRGTVVIVRAGTAQVRTRTGTYDVKAGQYLMARGDEEPETGRGTFSRDRFDLWVADRLGTVEEARTASARYVSDEYAGDVAAMDGYGDWGYDSSYGGEVWSPRVDPGWSPYSYGSWYYTPAGMTWWSNDPWGWYPFHYGNWFYASARNRWCWAPASVYSPAWVYWAYAPGYVGWCPTGYYSFYSPWYDTYRHWGLAARANLSFAIQGTFATRRMDFHGWNFTGTGSFGAPQARMNVVPGTRIAERLGTQVAVSSQPIVVNAREGGVREAIRTYVREAPRVIERAAGPDSERLAPVLARDRTLPADTLAALRERVVVAERGRLTGPAAAEIAPRASASAVERSRALPPVSGGRAPVAAERWRTSERGPVAGADQPQARIVPRAGASETWRARGNPSSALAREVAPRERATAPDRQSEIPRTDRAEGRPSVVSHESWRSRPDLPPARRVIEGAVPERRAPERRSEPIPRERIERAPVALPPPARVERPPVPAAPPAHVDRAPSNSAPPAPAPRSEVRHESPPQRSAPAPQAERGRPN
jgi:hypothetical protein